MRTYTTWGHLRRALSSVLAALFLTALAADGASVYRTHRIIINTTRHQVITAGRRIGMVSGQVSPSNHRVKHGANQPTDFRVRHGFAKRPGQMLGGRWQ